MPLSVLGIVLLLAWAMYPAIRVQYQTSRQTEGLQAEYDGLRQRNEALRAEVADLKTPEGVERAARESLGFAKKGENVYVVMPTDEASGTAQESTAAEGSESSGSDPLTALFDVIFGLGQ